MADLLDAFAVLASAYPRDFGRFSESEINAWRSLLDDADPARVISACNTLARTNKWAPTIAEIREAAGCDDPAAVERRAASAAAASKHATWVAEQERRATEAATKSLKAAGITPQPVPIRELLEGVGR